MAPTIRILTPDDAEAYLAHRREALLDAPLAFESSSEDDLASSVEAVRDILGRAPEAVVFGAFTDGLVGSVGIFRNRHVKCAHRTHVWGMYVSPGARGRGVGQALLEAAVGHARAFNGVSQVNLCVSDTAEAAVRLYQRSGFRVWGTAPDSLRHGGRSAAEIHLLLELDADG